MRVSRLASAVAVAVMLVAPVLVSASDSNKTKTASKSASTVSSKTVQASPMATLKGVKAAPMSSGELADVKGLHVHFWNPGAPFPGEPHLAGANNTKNWSDLFGTGEPVANSYHGLCNAATNGNSAIFINPGGGCGF